MHELLKYCENIENNGKHSEIVKQFCQKYWPIAPPWELRVVKLVIILDYRQKLPKKHDFMT